MDRIGKSDGKVRIDMKWYDTTDIIKTLLKADESAGTYTRDFAPTLRGDTDADTCYNIWQWVRDTIRYADDTEHYGPNEQQIKSPGYLYQTRVGDCKSMSLFTASCLQNLGIPYCYRFISQDAKTDYHHVYIVTDSGIVIDCVYNQFNASVPYAKKKDMRPKNYRIAGGLLSATEILPTKGGVLTDGTVSDGNVGITPTITLQSGPRTTLTSNLPLYTGQAAVNIPPSVTQVIDPNPTAPPPPRPMAPGMDMHPLIKWGGIALIGILLYKTLKD